MKTGTRTPLRIVLVAVFVALLATACWAPSFTPDKYGVTVESDIVYGQGEVGGGGSFVDLELDLYKPEGTGQTQLPLVVVVHGGGFVGGSKTMTNVVDWARRFAGRGFIVASIDYRLAGSNPVPSDRVQSLYDAVAPTGTAQQVAAVAAMDDTLTALDYLVARPDTVDNLTTLVGGSAGAITVDYVAYALDDFGIERPPIAAVVSNWGGFPILGSAADFIQNPTPGTSTGYREPPIFMAHTTGDTTVPYSLSTDIAAQATAVGLDNELFTKQSNAHGFDLTTTEYEPGVTVLDAQISFATCSTYGFLADRPECS